VSRVVFLLEEPSMKTLLDGLLPRLFPSLVFQCVPHEGRQDLAKSVPRKLRAWREPGVRFVVLRDNDSGDCHALKRLLSDLCRQGGRSDSLVRIACQELEAWYLGDPAALADAYSQESLRRIGSRARFRDPDSIVKPSAAVRELIPSFQKTDGARRMAEHLSRDRNRSASFQVLMGGIENIWQDIR
jgi:hypothetical protein